MNHPASIANTFNNFFTSVAEIVLSKITFSNKSFKNFLSSEINYSFLTTTNKEEIYKIRSSLHSNNSGPNSILTKVLHLLQHQTSNHLATVCSLSFSNGVFPVILRTARVIPIYKKNSKLEVLDLILSYPILINVLKN